MEHFKRHLWKTVVSLTFAATTGLFSPQLAQAASTFYATPTGLDANWGTDPQNPTNLPKALIRAQSGDTILVATGVYAQQLNISTSNLTIKAASGAKPILRPSSPTVWQIVFIHDCENVTLDGFEVDGSVANASSLSVYADGVLMRNAKHITVTNNTVHDCSGAGIASHNPNTNLPNNQFQAGAAGGCDYITIKWNTIYNCCYWSPFDPSAISIHGNTNSNTADTSTHNYIQKNRIYGNISKYTSKAHTDGNGIIIDLCGGYDTASTPVAYPARTLIENNIVYLNGGRGIHVFKSSNVLIRNNTCYKNSQDTQIKDGEFVEAYAKEVITVNNVAIGSGRTYQEGGQTKTVPAFRTSNTYGTIELRYNTYGNAPTSIGTGATVDWSSMISGASSAGFVDPENANLAVRNFSCVVLGNGSRSAQNIIDVGSPTATDSASSDFPGVQRPNGGYYDRGAYETSVTSGANMSTSSLLVSMRPRHPAKQNPS